MSTTADPTTNPTDDSRRVWRYMNFARFVWLLQKKQLWLSRADLLGDPWEVTPSYEQVAQARRVTWSVIEPAYPIGRNPLKEEIENWRGRTFVNCWTEQKHESHALWRVYCGPTEGVAIRTTLARLRHSVGDLPVDRVVYRDPELRPLGRDILLTEPLALEKLALEKRPMFAYEHEVRIISRRPEPSSDLGYPLAWDPAKVLEYVYVHPDADSAFMETVQEIVTQYAPPLADRVRWSAMIVRPPC